MTDHRLFRRDFLALSTLLPMARPRPAWGADAPPAALDPARVGALVRPFMERFDIPGVAVGITAGGAHYAAGLGVRRLGHPELVDGHTLFAIGSNTKSFTCAAIAQLVDGGKLAWDTPVRHYIPEFRMSDPVATEAMTVRDLLVHRSGLSLGAGDLMYFPASTHVAGDALKALPFLKLERGFRAGYAYDNILYVVAGLLIERVTGRGWRDVITDNLLKRIGIMDTVASRWLVHKDNVAGRHARLGPPVRGMGPVREVEPDETPMIDAAGGINASAADILKWLDVQMSHGKLPDGERLWSESAASDLWTPATIVDSSDGPTAANPTRSVTTTYALGLAMSDYRGERIIGHTGGVNGMVTQTAMLPARKIGVAVFSNIEDEVSVAIRNAILDMMIGAPAFDWVAAWSKHVTMVTKEALARAGAELTQAPPGGPSLALSAYVGRYRDPWYGEVDVALKDGALAIDFVPTPVYKSVLEPWGKDAFRTRFPPLAGEDAVVSFHVQNGSIRHVTMRPLSPLADFSCDFQDLALDRID